MIIKHDKDNGYHVEKFRKVGTPTKYVTVEIPEGKTINDIQGILDDAREIADSLYELKQYGSDERITKLLSETFGDKLLPLFDKGCIVKKSETPVDLFVEYLRTQGLTAEAL